jgi:hypothetical protein
MKGLHVRAVLSGQTTCEGSVALVAGPRQGVPELIEIHRIAQRYTRLALTLTSPHQSIHTRRYASVSLETEDGTVIHRQVNHFTKSEQEPCLPGLSLVSLPSSRTKPKTAKSKARSLKSVSSGRAGATRKSSRAPSKLSRPSGSRARARGGSSSSPPKSQTQAKAKKAKVKGRGKGAGGE